MSPAFITNNVETVSCGAHFTLFMKSNKNEIFFFIMINKKKKAGGTIYGYKKKKIEIKIKKN